jgi:hypothetical protein
MFMAVDQHGQTYHNLVHPRKDLLERLGYKHADKVYVDNTKTGKARHCGYVIGGHWLEVYEVRPINV